MEYFLPYQLTANIAATGEGELLGPEGTQGGKSTCHPSASCQTAATPYSEPRGSSEREKHRKWPQMAEVRVKGMTSVSPDACPLPYIEKH